VRVVLQLDRCAVCFISVALKLPTFNQTSAGLAHIQALD
jgi:hypothetical protein